MFGYSGKILFVDLSNQYVREEDTVDYLEYVGGRGLNQWLLFSLTDVDTSPLQPESLIILGAGPLVGTLVPTASRLSLDFKNVITGGVGSANSGGQFAAEMKYAGYDHIIIYGKSEKPVYLFINDSRVYFRDARGIWGKNTWETESIIRSREGDRGIKTLSIGPAGENLVKFSCLISDRGRAAGYGGSGAIFGSKNLKAVVIRGHLPVVPAHPDKLLEKLKTFNDQVINKSPTIDVYRRGGTMLAYQIPGDKKAHGVRNMSDEYWDNESIAMLAREKFDEKFLIRRHSCFGCPAYCSGLYEIEGMLCEGIQANGFRAFGSNLDVKSPENLLRANTFVNLYGMDMDHTSSVIAWAIECYEKGILNKQDTDGLELGWGNGEAVVELVNRIAYRKGFGDILANGVYQASKLIGRGSEKYAVTVKKNGLMEGAMRSHKAWALGIVTSTKGGGHLRGAPGQEGQKIKPELSKTLFDIDDIYNPNSYINKASLVVWQERYKGVVDAIGICACTSMWMDVSLFTLKDISDFIFLVTGIEMSVDELMLYGERIQTIERVFNMLHAGFGRCDDMPPEKLVNVPVSEGIYKGERLDIEQWNEMLDEYYSIHQWDKDKGWPTRERLLDLGLEKVMEVIEGERLSSNDGKGERI